jgi:hypothetical protein
VPTVLLPLWLAAARADDPAPPPAPPPSEAGAEADPEQRPGEGTIQEIIVFGELEVAKRRRALHAELKSQGYREKKVKDDGTAVWRPEDPWKPSVEVHDEGFVTMRRSPVRFESYVKGDSPARWIACIPPFGLMCIRVGGQVVSKRKLDAQKARVADGMDAEVDAWSAAVMQTAMHRKIHVELPAALDATWAAGSPLEAGGPPLPTPADRRRALAEHWATRACTPEGAAVRQVLADFIENVVQASPDRLPADEVAAANARSACGDRLQGPAFAAP